MYPPHPQQPQPYPQPPANYDPPPPYPIWQLFITHATAVALGIVVGGYLLISIIRWELKEAFRAAMENTNRVATPLPNVNDVAKKPK